MEHLASRRTLQKTNLRRHDIVVRATVRAISPDSEYELTQAQIFGAKEQDVFSSVVTLAEKEGKTVELLVVPAIDPFDALVQTAEDKLKGRPLAGYRRVFENDV